MATTARFQATNTSPSSQNACISHRWFPSPNQPAAAHCCSCALLSKEWHTSHTVLFVSVSDLAQKKRKKDRKKHRPADTPEDLPAAPGQSVDKSYLCCEHHKAMIAGLALLKNPELLLGEEIATAFHSRKCVRLQVSSRLAALQLKNHDYRSTDPHIFMSFLFKTAFCIIHEHPSNFFHKLEL